MYVCIFKYIYIYASPPPKTLYIYIYMGGWLISHNQGMDDLDHIWNMFKIMAWTKPDFWGHLNPLRNDAEVISFYTIDMVGTRWNTKGSAAISAKMQYFEEIWKLSWSPFKSCWYGRLVDVEFPRSESAFTPHLPDIWPMRCCMPGPWFYQLPLQLSWNVKESTTRNGPNKLNHTIASQASTTAHATHAHATHAHVAHVHVAHVAHVAHAHVHVAHAHVAHVVHSLAEQREKTSKTSIKSCSGGVAVLATNSTKHHVQRPGAVGIVHAHSLTASIRGSHTDDLQAIQLTCKFELEKLESQQLKLRHTCLSIIYT